MNGEAGGDLNKNHKHHVNVWSLRLRELRNSIGVGNGFLDA